MNCPNCNSEMYQDKDTMQCPNENCRNYVKKGNQMSDTPRTDAAYFKDGEFSGITTYDLAGLCKQLERELAQALKDKERLDWLLSPDQPIFGVVDDRDENWVFSRDEIDEAMKGYYK